MRAIALRVLLATISSLLTATAAQALTGGSDDADNAVANSTVRVDYGCTGTLIAPTLVLSAGHCGNTASTDPEVDGTHVPMGQWSAMGSTYTIRIGPDPFTSDPDRMFRTWFVSQAGWADIVLYQLERPVPASLAIPAPPLTRFAGTIPDTSFWSGQNFTVAGYADGTPRRIATVSNGAFPCKTMANLFAGDEFFCALSLGGVQFELGDSGGPIYWSPPSSSARYVIGAFQGWGPLRTCPDPVVSVAGCGFDTLKRIDRSDPTCTIQTSEDVTDSIWSVSHHTATFAQGGRCWRSVDGVTRHQPNIAKWLDNALRWEPTESSAALGTVLQSGSGHAPLLDFTLHSGYTELGRTFVFNANAPYLWPATGIVPLWSWEIASVPGRLTYTTRFPGHAFTQPVLPNGLTLLHPAMVGYLYDPALPQPPGTLPLTTYVDITTNQMVTTWDLSLVVPAALRSRFRALRLEGYLPEIRLRPVPFRPAPPLRNRPTIQHPPVIHP